MPFRTFTKKTDRVITVTRANMYINTNIITSADNRPTMQSSVQNIINRKEKHHHDQHLSCKELSTAHH